MAQLYTQLTAEIAHGLKLIMADVDGTLTDSGNDIDDSVIEAVYKLQQHGILVGLVSGRTIPMLEELARILNSNGPIIAENGGVAKLKPGGELLDLGYSREPALKALAALKAAFPGCIKERYDNSERLIDIVFRHEGVNARELDATIKNVQLLDSGYICHLMQKGISKGKTLLKIIKLTDDSNISPEEMLVVGDSLTDLSLFELFPYSVLVPNYRMDTNTKALLQNAARYISINQAGKGFSEVAFHILNTRQKS